MTLKLHCEKAEQDNELKRKFHSSIKFYIIRGFRRSTHLIFVFCQLEQRKNHWYVTLSLNLYAKVKFQNDQTQRVGSSLLFLNGKTWK